MKAATAAQATPLITFMLPGTRYSVQMARFYVRAALGYHGLDDYAGDLEMVTSELVSNAITHAGARPFGLELLRPHDHDAVMVVVTDPCPLPPVKRDPAGDAEHGHGLLVVEALSASWGWAPRDPGKAVFAILTGQG